METNIIIEGDCLVKLKELPDNSIDSIVTDPPYGLSFMNKHWDYDVPSIDIWKECLRVLKPGGHLLAFGGTRTYHRMTSAIEDAGFEVRDMINWCYGSGFPKSLNVGKAIDKLQGNEREVVGRNPNSRENCNKTNTIYESGTVGKTDYLTKGTSEWEGWGTALKPAHEPICMARKPLSEKSVAENVLKWGTGGINIDESRVEANEELGRNNNARTSGTSYVVQKEAMRIDNSNGKRFPANLIHDNSEEVRECFPDTGKSNFSSNNKGAGFVANSEIYHNSDKYEVKGNVIRSYEGEGNASRFFKSIIYQAKASKSERNAGLDVIEDKNKRPQGEAFGDGSAITEHSERKGNFHPTVKPIALMEYLIKMVTPKGGIILDPFAGSGTTLIGAKLEGYSFIGIEMEPEYIKIARARLEAYK